MSSKDIDVARLIDERQLTKAQFAVFGLCGLVALLDGLDTTSIGVAAPAMAGALGLSIAAFGPVFAIALIGATLGALSFGPLADRLGRKRLLLVATAVFGLFSLLTAYCQSVPALLTCRFLAGVGMGGATPCFIALTSEYAPTRHRAAIVSLMWAAFPLGGTVGAFLNSALIETYGWRTIFYIGGVSPLVLLLALAIWLPESARFLIRRNRGADRRTLQQLMRRFFDLPAREWRYVVSETAAPSATFASLFAAGRATITLLLWAAFASIFAVLIVTTLWTPALLKSFGMVPAAGAIVVGVFNIGCTLGMAIAGRILERLGLARGLAPALLLGGAMLAVIGYVGHTLALVAMLAGVVGILIGVGASGVIALSTLFYPVEVRSTGVGWAMAAGRAGQSVAPVITGMLLAAGTSTPVIFVVIGLTLAVAAVLVLLLAMRTRDQAPPHRRRATPAIEIAEAAEA